MHFLLFWAHLNTSFKSSAQYCHLFPYTVSDFSLVNRSSGWCLSSLQAWLWTSSCPCQDTSTYWWSNLRPNTFCIYSEQKHPSEQSPKNKTQSVLMSGPPWALPLLQPRLPLQNISVSASNSCTKSSHELSTIVFYLFAYLCPISPAGQRKVWRVKEIGCALGFLSPSAPWLLLPVLAWTIHTDPQCSSGSHLTHQTRKGLTTRFINNLTWLQSHSALGLLTEWFNSIIIYGLLWLRQTQTIVICHWIIELA